VTRSGAQGSDLPIPAPQALEAPVLALVGRTVEWEYLTRAWLAGRRGPPRCLLVSGVAGIGKTRLVEEFVAAAGGVRTGWGAAVADAGAPAMWPWIRAVRGLPGPLGGLEIRPRVTD